MTGSRALVAALLLGLAAALLPGLAAALLLGLAVAPAPAAAISPEEVLADPALEARARALAREIRCMVCDGQAIGDSNAQVARDMRAFVRTRLADGQEEAAIRQALAARFGDQVLLRPPLDARTWLLWATPAVLLALGLGVVARRLLRGQAPLPGQEPTPLTAEEHALLARALGPQEPPR